MEVPLPLLVRVLGGNVVTAPAVLACLNTADATVLRRLHPALAAAVAAVPWADTNTEVRDIGRWRAALPAAVGMRLCPTAPAPDMSALAALSGVTSMELTRCPGVTDATIARLPPTLRALNVSYCRQLGPHASFTHLPALEWLDCSDTDVVSAGLARLPPSLRELHMRMCNVPDTADFSHLWHLRRMVFCHIGSREHVLSAATVASLPPSLEFLDVSGPVYFPMDPPMVVWPRDWSAAHLTRLRVFKASRSMIDDAAIATLPPSLHVLVLEYCYDLSSDVTFAHLTSLHTLRLCYTPYGSGTLATLPPSLVSLDLHHSGRLLPPAAVFPHLPALRVLAMNHTRLGDAAIASMPASLVELSMVCCDKVTQHARLDHLVALRILQCAGTELPPATIEACRVRGCFAPADGKLVPEDDREVNSLLLMPDDRLVSGAREGRVALWEAAAGHGGAAVMAELELRALHVNALVLLHGGYRVAVGTSDGIFVWDTRGAPHDASAAIVCASEVKALAVAHNGHLVVGCEDGKLVVVDLDAGAVVAALAAHSRGVRAVVMLLDGRLASAADDREVRLWDVGAGTCVATLEGHTADIYALVVLADGRLASGSDDHTVRLWDTASGACIRVLEGHTGSVRALAVLPGSQLASGSADGTIRVWDTRDDASGAGGSLARPPAVIVGSDTGMRLAALVPLPGDRLASGGYGGVYLWQLPRLPPQD